MIETSSDLPQKSSVIFGNSQQMFRNVCVAFGPFWKNLRKSSEIWLEIFGKSSKMSVSVCLYNV